MLEECEIHALAFGGWKILTIILHRRFGLVDED